MTAEEEAIMNLVFNEQYLEASRMFVSLPEEKGRHIRGVLRIFLEHWS